MRAALFVLLLYFLTACGDSPQLYSVLGVTRFDVVPTTSACLLRCPEHDWPHDVCLVRYYLEDHGPIGDCPEHCAPAPSGCRPGCQLRWRIGALLDPYEACAP